MAIDTHLNAGVITSGVAVVVPPVHIRDNLQLSAEGLDPPRSPLNVAFFFLRMAD